MTKKIQTYTAQRDKKSNIFAVQPQFVEGAAQSLLAVRTVNASTATGAAAAIQCTLAAESGTRWLLESAKVCVASIAANTAVNVTLVDGTTALAAFVIGANGVFELAPGAGSDNSMKYLATDNAALGLQVASGGTGSTTTANLIARKISTNDL